MTKYYSNNNRPNPYAGAPIPISTSEDDVEEIICSSCRVINYQTRGDDYQHRCKHCGHTLDVKQVETADIVESESMDSHNETLVANLPDANDIYHNRKKVEPQGAFKAMMDRGIHLTSYTERSGDGRVLRSYSNSSSSHTYSDGSQRRSTSRPTRPTSDSDSNSDSGEQQ
jgi:hypothetical protein